MLSARNVSNSGIDLDPGFRLVSEEDYLEEAKRAEPQSGDVLLTIVGTIGRTTVVRKQSLPFVLQRSVALLRPSRDLLPEYLSYWLESPEIQHFLLSNARGTAQKGVYLKTLRGVLISYPSLDAQKEICAKLDLQLSRHASCVWQLKQIQAKLKQARASILKAAVEGRLVETEAELARREKKDYESGSILLEKILYLREKNFRIARQALVNKIKYSCPFIPSKCSANATPEGWTYATIDQ